VRVIAKSTLRTFWKKHPDSEQALKSWYKEATDSSWKTPGAVKANYPTCSILPGQRVVFRIKGNKYRLVVRINDDYGIVWIRFVGTHKAYDNIDAQTI
jgi:mRNA interferase HigB